MRPAPCRFARGGQSVVREICDAMSAEPVVVKLGGSLLSQPRWPEWLELWLGQQPPAAYLLIVGGGQAIDAMRHLDQTHTLDTAAMHWRCIRLLDATFEVAAELLRRPERRFDWQLIDSADQLIGVLSPPRASTGPAPESESPGAAIWNSGSTTERPHDALTRPCSLVRVASFYRPPATRRLPACPCGTGYRGSELEQLGSPDTSGIPEDWRTTTDCLALHLAQLLAARRVVLLKSCPVGHLSGVQQAVSEGIIDPAVPLLKRRCQPHTLELVQLGAAPLDATVSRCTWPLNR